MNIKNIALCSLLAMTVTNITTTMDFLVDYIDYATSTDDEVIQELKKRYNNILYTEEDRALRFTKLQILLTDVQKEKPYFFLPFIAGSIAMIQTGFGLGNAENILSFTAIKGTEDTQFSIPSINYAAAITTAVAFYIGKMGFSKAMALVNKWNKLNKLENDIKYSLNY